MPRQPGDHLGPYEIAGFVGAGGMGEVYRARDPRLNRDVAVKVLHAARKAVAVSYVRAAGGLDRIEQVPRDLPPADGVLHRLHLKVLTEGSVGDDVHQRSQWRRDSNAFDRFDVFGDESGAVKLEDVRDCRHALKPRGDGHVQAPRHRVGEFMARQRRGVAEGALRLAGTVV